MSIDVVLIALAIDSSMPLLLSFQLQLAGGCSWIMKGRVQGRVWDANWVY